MKVVDHDNDFERIECSELPTKPETRLMRQWGKFGYKRHYEPRENPTSVRFSWFRDQELVFQALYTLDDAAWCKVVFR